LKLEANLSPLFQALASLPSFLSRLAYVHSQAISSDIPTPLLDALLPLLLTLNSPSSSSSSRPLRPTDLVEALMESDTLRRSGIFNRGMREQQDAQELWLLLVGAVEEEAEKVGKEVDGGLAEGKGWGKEGLAGLVSDVDLSSAATRNPFEGKSAYRRSCQMSVSICLCSRRGLEKTSLIPAAFVLALLLQMWLRRRDPTQPTRQRPTSRPRSINHFPSIPPPDLHLSRTPSRHSMP
jgi:hypothetical protein